MRLLEGLSAVQVLVVMEPEKEGKSKKRSLKQRIRDTKRLLARDDLPETVRLTKEQVLRLLDQELTGQQHEQRSKKVAKKYRMVRFFEKRKVSRRLKSKLKEVTSCTDEIERSELLAEIHQLKRELNYVTHYPPEQKYVALYPSTEATSDKTLLKRERLMSQITEQVASGTLPDATENIPYSRHPIKLAGPMQSKRSETDSSFIGPTLNESADARPSEEVPRCSLGKGGMGDGTNRERKDHGTASGKAVKRRLAAVDEEPDSESELYQNSRKRLKDDDFFLQDEGTE